MSDKMSQEDIDRMLREATEQSETEKGEATAFSQDDIDGLLADAKKNTPIETGKSQLEIMKEEKSKIRAEKGKGELLTQIEKDIIGELANISFGSASTTLSTLLNQSVNITTPDVEIIDADAAVNDEVPHVVLNVNFIKGLEMENLLVIKQDVALSIADLMMMGSGKVEPDKELGELELSAVQEAMNQMMGTAATSMSEMFNELVDISPPLIKVVNVREELDRLPDSASNKVVKISLNLDIGSFIESKLVQIVPIKNAKEMARKLLSLTKNGDSSDNGLSEYETASFSEFIDVSFEAAANALNQIVNKTISLKNREIIVVNKPLHGLGSQSTIISFNLSGGIESKNLFSVSNNFSLLLSDLMVMGAGEVSDDKELGEFELSAIQEAANQMLGASITALVGQYGKAIEITPPEVKLNNLENECYNLFGEDTSLVQVSVGLELEGLGETQVVHLIKLEDVKEIVNSLFGQEVQTSEEISEQTSFTSTNNTISAAEAAINVPGKSAEESEKSDIRSILRNVNVKVEVVFGKTRKTLKELLSFQAGQVVALKEGIDEPLEIYANGVLVAEGEIVNVDGYFGVKIKNTYLK